MEQTFLSASNGERGTFLSLANHSSPPGGARMPHTRGLEADKNVCPTRFATIKRYAAFQQARPHVVSYCMPSVVASVGNASNSMISRSLPSITVSIFLLIAYLVFGRATVFGAETQNGQAIYKEECARCHGPTGEGTKKTTHPLAGEKSPSQRAFSDRQYRCRMMIRDHARMKSIKRWPGIFYDAFYSHGCPGTPHYRSGWCFLRIT